MNDRFYSYLYRDPKTDVAIYVGKGRGSRAFAHFNARTRLGNLLRKRVAEGFQVKPEITYHRDEELAFFVEQESIRKYGRADMGAGTLFNLTDGGEGSSNPSHETRRKIALSLIGTIQSPETKAKRSRTKTGIACPADVRLKIAAALAGRKLTSQRVENIRMAMNKMSEEDRQSWKEQVSSAKSGVPWSPERRAAQENREGKPYRSRQNVDQTDKGIKS